MSRSLATWIMTGGGVLLAFGLLRVYSIYFADPAVRDDLLAKGEAVLGWVTLGVGAVLAVGGWLMRRANRES
jgi:hypothetical protein